MESEFLTVVAETLHDLAPACLKLELSHPCLDSHPPGLHAGSQSRQTYACLGAFALTLSSA